MKAVHNAIAKIRQQHGFAAHGQLKVDELPPPKACNEAGVKFIVYLIHDQIATLALTTGS